MEYTQEKANRDVLAAEDSILICEQIKPIAESDRTEDQVGDFFRNERRPHKKMSAVAKT